MSRLPQIEVIFQNSFVRRCVVPDQEYRSLHPQHCIVSLIHHGVMASMFMQIYSPDDRDQPGANISSEARNNCLHSAPRELGCHSSFEKLPTFSVLLLPPRRRCTAEQAVPGGRTTAPCPDASCLINLAPPPTHSHTHFSIIYFEHDPSENSP